MTTVSPEQFLRVLANEVVLHRAAVVWGFVIISLGFLGAGLVIPKKYSATATILVDSSNIIRPLTEGVAAPTDVRNYARIAEELINSRKVIDDVARDSGLTDETQSAFEQEVIKEKLREAIDVSSVGSNLIKITYKDVIPERAANVVNGLARMFVLEGATFKDRESRSAFEFIDKQVKEYHDKLVEAERKLKELRSNNLDAQPGSEASIQARINELQGRYERTKLELAEAKIRYQSVKRQLEGESAVAVSLSREGQYHNRIIALQQELDSLRLRYKDDHPDVVRTRHQIEDLQEAIRKEVEAREAAKRSGRKMVIDNNELISNPLYQQLRSQLSAAETQIETLQTRLRETKALLAKEQDRGRRLHESEAALAEFTRDYEVNRDIYQQLLTRRERARVSMNLDVEGEGINFRVHESATIPVKPVGLRFMHFMIAGLVLGIAIPIGLVYAKIQIDPRVRFPSLISARAGLPVVAEVPHLATMEELSRRRVGGRMMIILVIIVLGVYGYIGWLKMTRGI